MSSGPLNTATSYGSVARVLHWLTALLILTEIPLGLIANRLPVSNDVELARAAQYFSLHKTVGVTIFAVALVRIAWALCQPRPAALHPERSIATFAASAVHWSLYLALVLVPLTGWISHAASTGFAPIWAPIGQTLPFVPKSEGVAQIVGTLHVLFGRVLAVSLLLHVAGALKHLFIDRDDTFAGMWSGRSSGSVADEPPSSSAPALVALGAYTIAVAFGLALGSFAPTAPANLPAGPMSASSTEWAVQNGAIRITVRQLGTEVTGEFADWTAAIDFDPKTGTGSTDVEVSIASLSLGQVTANALGPDFFDARTHPTASFNADVSPDGTRFLATGELTIKGAKVPLLLPFTLDLEGTTARMTGAARVDRREFGIGTNYNDESNVGFAVDIAVELVAQKTGTP